MRLEALVLTAGLDITTRRVRHVSWPEGVYARLFAARGRGAHRAVVYLADDTLERNAWEVLGLFATDSGWEAYRGRRHPMDS